ncbi:class I SAM-dependent methyltransferase [Marixanthomonas sp. SCSIO 43207]|nr:class I SAM-dependent methyltransferase [Marixanthomonas sp. SCSIO 43207]UAB82579.1 class I SAM-dependent methyltransferase [Marixanthomonas sp. SCSIO 43207]
MTFNKEILSFKIQEFIKTFSEDISQLAFSGSPFNSVTVQELIQQIESRRKAEKKLPTWYQTDAIFYPKKLNIEQTSSETTAAYKATLIQGNRLADLTGGFGVDSYYFSKQANHITHFETNAVLSKIAEHNFKQLNANNITCKNEDGILGVLNEMYDTIYVDPSRRHDTKGKVFFLNDCEPNIPKHLPQLVKNCKLLIIKTAPMLDISVGLKELDHVFQLHIVAINNEVKELLWMIKPDYSNDLTVITKNFTKENTEETFSFIYREQAEVFYDSPKRFLYEPNAAIMKSGAFFNVSESFKVKKLHENTHLYTSESLRAFPGRRFLINDILPYSKKNIKKEAITKANITTRNFPESVSSIRKKFKIKDGGDTYLFFTTIQPSKKVILVCSKV